MYKVEKRNNMVLGIIISAFTILWGIVSIIKIIFSVRYYNEIVLIIVPIALYALTVIASIACLTLTVLKKKQPGFAVPIIYIGIFINFIAGFIFWALEWHYNYYFRFDIFIFDLLEILLYIVVLIVPSILIIVLFNKPSHELYITCSVITGIVTVVLLFNAFVDFKPFDYERITYYAYNGTFWVIAKWLTPIISLLIAIQVIRSFKFIKEPITFKPPIQQNPYYYPVQPVQPMPMQPQVPVTPPVPNANEGDSIEQLERLAALKDKGVITEEEFNAKKEELLRRV